MALQLVEFCIFFIKSEEVGQHHCCLVGSLKPCAPSPAIRMKNSEQSGRELAEIW